MHHKILFLVYYFPPIGGGGVQRTIKFLKYLPEFGFSPVVVTGPSIGGQWSPLDKTLSDQLKLMPPPFRIQNSYKEPSRIVHKLRKLLALKTPFAEWWFKGSVGLIKEILSREKIDLIYCSMSPFASALIGNYFRKEYGIRWIADLRDPWALDEMQIYPSFLHRKVELKKMRKLLWSASGIIMNTPEAAKRLNQAFPEFQDKRIICITNGYDSEDFVSLSSVNRRRDKFRIVHTGSLHTRLGLQLRRRRMLYNITGGSIAGLDILSRSHFFILQAIEKWLKFSQELLEKIELVLVGALSYTDKRIIWESGLPHKLVKSPGYLSYSQNISLMMDADLLFLPMHNLPNSVRATIVPGKTYEYMATGNPILAAVPEGDAKDFLQKCGTAFICKPNDVRGMVEIMEKTFQAWVHGKKIVEPNWHFIKQFSRKRLTAKLAGFLDSILEENYEN